MTDINVKIKLESPELMAALLAFAEALPQIQIGSMFNIKEGQTVEAIKLQAPKEKLETSKQEVKEITLQEVRDTLVRLSKNGKAEEVKALIKKFGATKLTELPKEKYSELLKEADSMN